MLAPGDGVDMGIDLRKPGARSGRSARAKCRECRYTDARQGRDEFIGDAIPRRDEYRDRAREMFDEVSPLVNFAQHLLEGTVGPEFGALFALRCVIGVATAVLHRRYQFVIDEMICEFNGCSCRDHRQNQGHLVLL